MLLITTDDNPGKLCLRDKALAKRSVNLFVRELDTAAAPAVRSNALVVLGDLTVRCVDACVFSSY